MCITYNNLTEVNCKRQEMLSNPKKRKLLKRRKVTFSPDMNTLDFAENSNGDFDSVPPPAPLETHTDHYDSWYTPENLEEFKNNIKEQAKRYRALSNKAISSTATESSLVLPFHNCGLYKKMKYIVKVQNKLSKAAAEITKLSSKESSFRKSFPEFRGLEHRIFFERQRNKTIATKAVLEFQRRCELMLEEARENQRTENEISDMKRQFAEQMSTMYSQLSQWAKDEALTAGNYDASGVYTVPSSSEDDKPNSMAKLARDTRTVLSRKRKARVVSDDDSSASSSSGIKCTSAECTEQGRQFKRARVSCTPLD